MNTGGGKSLLCFSHGPHTVLKMSLRNRMAAQIIQGVTTGLNDGLMSVGQDALLCSELACCEGMFAPAAALDKKQEYQPDSSFVALKCGFLCAFFCPDVLYYMLIGAMHQLESKEHKSSSYKN